MFYMSAEIIYGDQLSQTLRDQMKTELANLKKKGIHPKLTVILIGDHPASRSYVSGKQKAAEYIGMDSELLQLSSETTEEELLSLIYELNQDDSVNGILVQLPLPTHINEQRVIEAISPIK